MPSFSSLNLQKEIIIRFSQNNVKINHQRRTGDNRKPAADSQCLSAGLKAREQKFKQSRQKSHPPVISLRPCKSGFQRTAAADQGTDPGHHRTVKDKRRGKRHNHDRNAVNRPAVFHVTLQINAVFLGPFGTDAEKRRNKRQHQQSRHHQKSQGQNFGGRHQSIKQLQRCQIRTPFKIKTKKETPEKVIGRQPGQKKNVMPAVDQFKSRRQKHHMHNGKKRHLAAVVTHIGKTFRQKPFQRHHFNISHNSVLLLPYSMINRIKTQEHSFPYVIFITIFLRQNAVRLTNVNGPSGTVGHRTEVNVAVITRRIKNIHFLNRSVAVEICADFNDHVLNSHGAGVKVPALTQTGGDGIGF
nr:MAG TPA: hypothetical protein [Caudoviricetes sp.]